MSRVLSAAEPVALALVPVALGACAFLQFDQTALLTLAVAVLALAVFFASWEKSRPPLRQVMPTVVLGALAAAGRILFAPVPDVKPVSAICILAGVVFGRRSGFMVGALAALVSNFFFGQGAWTPWQMYSWGMIGYLAGVLADRGVFGESSHLSAFGELGKSSESGKLCQSNASSGSSACAPSDGSAANRLKHRHLVVYVYGFLSAFFYGALLNTWTLVGFVHPITWESALLTYGAGLPFDAVHAVATVVFLRIIYAPWRAKLERIKRKYELL